MYHSASLMEAMMTYNAQRLRERVGVFIITTRESYEQKHKENQAVLPLVKLELLIDFWSCLCLLILACRIVFSTTKCYTCIVQLTKWRL